MVDVGPPQATKKTIDILNSIYDDEYINFEGYLKTQMTHYSIWKEELERMNYNVVTISELLKYDNR